MGGARCQVARWPGARWLLATSLLLGHAEARSETLLRPPGNHLGESQATRLTDKDFTASWNQEPTMNQVFDLVREKSDGLTEREAACFLDYERQLRALLENSTSNHSHQVGK